MEIHSKMKAASWAVKQKVETREFPGTRKSAGVNSSQISWENKKWKQSPYVATEGLVSKWKLCGWNAAVSGYERLGLGIRRDYSALRRLYRRNTSTKEKYSLVSFWASSPASGLGSRRPSFLLFVVSMRHTSPAAMSFSPLVAVSPANHPHRNGRWMTRRPDTTIILGLRKWIAVLGRKYYALLELFLIELI